MKTEVVSKATFTFISSNTSATIDEYNDWTRAEVEADLRKRGYTQESANVWVNQEVRWSFTYEAP